MIAFVLVFFLFITGNAQSFFQVGTGVSETLAKSRKKNLSGINYQLDLEIPGERSKTIPATETITVTIADPSIPLQIDFKDLIEKLQSVIVNGKRSPVHYFKEQIVIAPFLLKKGVNTIFIKFFAGELSLNRKEDFLYTLLVPDRARTFFPCFDQPDLKARFTVSLTIPEGWKAITNAPLKKAGKKLEFETSDLIPTYLFSIVAGKFSEVSKDTRIGKMKFLHRETDSTKLKLSLEQIFKLHGRSLEFLEAYTGIDYPFKKFDFAAIPDFQYGGMEHVGAVDYVSSTLFLDSGATINQQNARANLIAHETSHMWFGDLVTMQWFNDVWMKEVFANFMADKINRDSSSTTNFELKFLTTHYPAAYSIDRTKGANPIRQPLENLNEAGTLYGPIIYNKAPIMMRQLEMLMGAKAFQQGIREYLKKFAFSNAGWPSLVAILDKYTPADLQAWNQVWVNTPGRPVFTHDITYKDNRISSFVIRQKAERGGNEFWPQLFEVSLVYPDTIVRTNVKMTSKQTTVNAFNGKAKPVFILFNSTGVGYGLFPLDKSPGENFSLIKDPVMRASAYINLYENLLDRKGFTPQELLDFYSSIFEKEDDELNLTLITGQFSEVFWRMLKPQERLSAAASLESRLQNILPKMNTGNKKKVVFRTWQNIALNVPAMDSLYKIWKNKTPPEGVRLTEDDYTSLAVSLVLKNYPDDSIIQKQILRITNPDRKERLQFMVPALSNNEATRDSFFNSLKDLSVRKNESRVAEALGYLHHPLRTDVSVKYLKPSLEMLEEIQKTGDIFFPAAWLNATFRNYQEEKAWQIVKEFLNARPDYNPRLKMKILQATDGLERVLR